MSDFLWQHPYTGERPIGFAGTYTLWFSTDEQWAIAHAASIGGTVLETSRGIWRVHKREIGGGK